MGQCVNGYIYHTKYDRYDIIPPGSIQNTGENALSLIVGLASEDWTESTVSICRINWKMFREVLQPTFLYRRLEPLCSLTSWVSS